MGKGHAALGVICVFTLESVGNMAANLSLADTDFLRTGVLGLVMGAALSATTTAAVLVARVVRGLLLAVACGLLAYLAAFALALGFDQPFGPVLALLLLLAVVLG